MKMMPQAIMGSVCAVTGVYGWGSGGGWLIAVAVLLGLALLSSDIKE